MDLQKETYDPNGKVAQQTEEKSKAFGIIDKYIHTHTYTHTHIHTHSTSQEVQPVFEVHRPGSRYLAVQVVSVKAGKRRSFRSSSLCH